MHWPRLGNHVQLSGYRRRTNQSGRTVFLFLEWIQNRRAEQFIYYSVQSDCQPAHNASDSQRPGLCVERPDPHGLRRYWRRNGGSCGQQKISGATVDKLFMVLMVAIIFISVYNTVRYSMA